jgi:hypothetical protein
MKIIVKLTPLSGEGMGEPLIFAEINYLSPVRGMCRQCLVTPQRLENARQKKFRAIVFPDEGTAKRAIQEFLNTLRANYPRLREFTIEYENV